MGPSHVHACMHVQVPEFTCPPPPLHLLCPPLLLQRLLRLLLHGLAVHRAMDVLLVLGLAREVGLRSQVMAVQCIRASFSFDGGPSITCGAAGRCTGGLGRCTGGLRRTAHRSQRNVSTGRDSAEISASRWTWLLPPCCIGCLLAAAQTAQQGRGAVSTTQIVAHQLINHHCRRVPFQLPLTFAGAILP